MPLKLSPFREALKKDPKSWIFPTPRGGGGVVGKDLYLKCVYLWFPETWGLIPFSCFLCWSLGSELRFVSCLFSILFEKLHLESRGSNWFEVCTVGDTKGFRLKWHLQLVQRFLLAIESCKSYHILLSSPVTEGLWLMLESSSK